MRFPNLIYNIFGARVKEDTEESVNMDLEELK